MNLSEKIYELMASHEVDHLFQNIAAKVKQVCRIWVIDNDFNRLALKKYRIHYLSA